MFKVVNAITNDLSMYMWGSSISKDGGMHVLQVSPKDRPWPYDELNEESYAPTSSVRFQRGGRELEKGRGNIDCGEFRKDLRDFSTSFSKMVYAISEKCYRQCYPNGYAHYAVQRLQRTFENHYNGGFYRQIREIEAETDCRFHDHFLIENERAVDYTKIWIETYQRHVTPCANLKNADNDTEADEEPLSGEWEQRDQETVEYKKSESGSEKENTSW